MTSVYEESISKFGESLYSAHNLILLSARIDSDSCELTYIG